MTSEGQCSPAPGSKRIGFDFARFNLLVFWSPGGVRRGKEVDVITIDNNKLTDIYQLYCKYDSDRYLHELDKLSRLPAHEQEQIYPIVEQTKMPIPFEDFACSIRTMSKHEFDDLHSDWIAGYESCRIRREKKWAAALEGIDKEKLLASIADFDLTNLFFPSRF